jgi:ATP-binding cassette subfamily C (CFTR/MRP) protein 1
MVAALAIILVATVVTCHNKFSAGSVGVSLLMVIGFSETLARLIQSWTKLESSIGVVARVKRFTNDTESEKTEDRNSSLSPKWPQAGTIEFKDVVASYA